MVLTSGHVATPGVHTLRPRARLGFDAGRLGFRTRASSLVTLISRQSRGGRRWACHHGPSRVSEEGACALGQVASPGACSAAARVSKARVRRRPARIPNPSLQPHDPDPAGMISSAVHGQMRRRRSCGAEERVGRAAAARNQKS